MKIYTSIIFHVLFLTTSLAQYGETIRSARPGQAIGAYAVGKKVFQIQTGFLNNFHNNPQNNIYSLEQSTVFRIGVLEKLEFNTILNWKYENLGFYGVDQPEKNSGISHTQINLRYNILEGSGWIPAIGVQGGVLLNVQSEYFRREKIAYRFLFATGSKITDWLFLTTNWGFQNNGNEKAVRAFYIINTSFSITKKLGAFLEVYGDFNEIDLNIDGGFSYLVNNNTQLDLSLGWQGEKDITDWFIDMGISWRIDWRD